jgi:hypothetical protein
MRKYPLIGGSIIAVVLLVLCSLTNVIGYQTVQSSKQKILNEEMNQKDILFQTIVDIANNKEIQKIILNTEIQREGFFHPGVRFSRFTPQVLTKDLLNRMYIVGLMLSKIISKTKIHSAFGSNQVSNQGIQKEMTTVVGKNATLNLEITQLSESKCDCEKNPGVTSWNFPVLCTFLIIIGTFIQNLPSPFPHPLAFIIELIIILLGCEGT